MQVKLAVSRLSRVQNCSKIGVSKPLTALYNGSKIPLSITNKEIEMTDQLEQILQEKVNMVAEVLIQKYPEIAKNDPKQIGKMAKEIVFQMANIAADIVNGK